MKAAVVDAEKIATLVKEAARPSLSQAVRVIGKLAAISLLGFALAGRCNLGFACLQGCFSEYLLEPAGVIVIAVAAAWVDVIQKECKKRRFFPTAILNSVGTYLFRWEIGLAVALLLSAVSSVSTAMKYAALPLALMHMVRFIEPFHFRRAREDLGQAESLVQRLVDAQSPQAPSESKVRQSSSVDIDIDSIPLYKLGSVASLLRRVVADFQQESKLSVTILEPKDTKPMSAFSVLFAPFRFVAGEIFLWEDRDVWLYGIVVVFLGLIYLGSYHIWFAPLGIVFPLFGPKSRAVRYVRALQEDLRVEQGKTVEKKGGMTPEVVNPWKFPINWPMSIYIIGTHVMALWSLIVIFIFGGVCPFFGNGKPMKMQTFAFAFFMYIIAGLGITAGVHRLWAHRSYKACFAYRFVLMIFNSVANQGTIMHWARDHRTHHLYSDTAADPHDANLGFWFSHVGWLLTKKRPEVSKAGREVNCSDLYADPIVMLQKRMDPFWNLLWCFAFPAFMSLAWDDTMWNGFLLGGVLRYTLVLNATWAVNSVVHAWGPKPYNPAHRTTENGWVSLFAMGEGWHNWHHAFPWDYAASELEPLYQFNPTKVFIDFCALLGLVWDRKRGDKIWAQRKTRWEEQNGRKVIESLEGPPLFKNRVVTFGPQEYGGEHQGWGEDTPVRNALTSTSKQD
jgi:stearoyl-CoA desaturase (delta-9 desaturase)